MAQKIRAFTSHNLIRSSKNFDVQKQTDLLDIGEKKHEYSHTRYILFTVLSRKINAVSLKTWFITLTHTQSVRLLLFYSSVSGSELSMGV